MGECMTFPKTFEEFAEQYGFTDKQEVYTNGSELIPVFRVKQWLDRPSADVAPVVHGEWKFEWDAEKDPKKYFIRIVCSRCGLKTGGKSNYCPNCGAKMDGERKEK